MEEIVEELEAGLERTRTELVEAGLRDYESMDETKTVEDVVYFNYFNHFPKHLPTSKSKEEFMRNREYVRGVLQRRSGKSLEEFEIDIFTAIQESGVDKTALGEYIDSFTQGGKGGLYDLATAEIYQRLFVPVYLKLRGMGYTKFELTGASQ